VRKTSPISSFFSNEIFNDNATTSLLLYVRPKLHKVHRKKNDRKRRRKKREKDREEATCTSFTLSLSPSLPLLVLSVTFQVKYGRRRTRATRDTTHSLRAVRYPQKKRSKPLSLSLFLSLPLFLSL
jgi:hypothetical protein